MIIVAVVSRMDGEFLLIVGTWFSSLSLRLCDGERRRNLISFSDHFIFLEWRYTRMKNPGIHGDPTALLRRWSCIRSARQ